MSTCPRCSGQLKYIQQYNQWFCYTCGQYMQPQQRDQPPLSQYQPPKVQPKEQQPVAQAKKGLKAGDLEFETVHSPTFTALVFYLKKGQSVVVKKGAMMYMHRTIEIQTKARKEGILKGIGTSNLGGESLSVNAFIAMHGSGELALVGPTTGDVRVQDVSQHGMILQSSAYLASSPEVNLDSKWRGLKGFLAEKDFLMLHASGSGSVWLSSFGGIIEMNLRHGETLSVDTGHLVAFPNNLQFEVRRVGGWKSTVLSGESLVTDFTGPGKIMMQTRHLHAFVQSLIPHLPQQNR
ncbi:MAG: TIGR00266 family protein [Thermoplasmata archaeon]|nr:MAG: TIGR00266 family protein [Thermoplasmata archaeon]